MRKLILAVIFAMLVVPAAARTSSGPSCVVNTPDGKPSDVQTRPGGPVTGKIKNGVNVEIADEFFEPRWKVTWVLVTPMAGKIGWVVKDDLNCPRK